MGIEHGSKRPPSSHGRAGRRPAMGIVTVATLALAGLPALGHADPGATLSPGASAHQVVTSPAPPLRVAKLTVYTGQVRRGARVFVNVSAGADKAEAGRTLVVDARVGSNEARVCESRLDRFGGFRADCRVDQLFPRRPSALVVLRLTLEATADAAEVTTTATRGVARPLGRRLVEGVGIPGGLAIGDSRALFIKRFGKPSWYSGLVSPFYGRGKLRGLLLFDPSVKTRRGVRIGSTNAAVQRAYPNASCITGPDGRPICFLSSTSAGRRTEMYFRFGASRTVAEISVHPPGAYGGGYIPGAPEG